MTRATTAKFSQFLVQLGDGATPETFSRPCGLNSRSFNRTAATNDTNVPDCDNEDAPSWLEREVVSLSASISGAGVVDTDDFAAWNDWLEAGATKNVKISLGANTIVWIGPYKCTKLNVSGNRGSRVTFDVTLDSDGETTKQ